MSKVSVAKNGRLRQMCRKTEMCRFYQRGACKRGSACDFAHEEQDVRAKPDLQRTKPCPTLAAGQCCEDPSCPFAHCAGELRRFKPHLLVVDQGVAASTMKKSGRTVKAERFLSNCSTATSLSCGQANSDTSTDCTGSLNFDLDGYMGSFKVSSDKIKAGASWSRQTTACSDSGFSRQISDSGFGDQISDSGFSRQISDSAFGRQVSNSGFSRQISNGGFSRQLSACSEGEHNTQMRSMMEKCGKDEGALAHGAHEPNSRASSKESVCWPPPSMESTSEGTSSEHESDGPGQQPSSSGDEAWAPVTSAELGVRPGQPAPHRPSLGEEEEEEECQLIVRNTFLALVGSSTPKELQRSSSTPPGK